ncbi:MAG: class I SAM-dependent methyltransferase [Anaerolineales bacterium]
MSGDTTPLNADYLAAKKSIDDRSLNSHVWRELWHHAPAPPLRVLELGAGIGTMLERLLERGDLRQAQYTALDIDPSYLALAKERIQGWAAAESVQCAPLDGGLHLKGRDLNLKFRFVTDDITQGIRDQVGGEWDLLIGNALLDLVHIPSVLPELLALLQAGGLFYFSITFDGLTHFEPILDPELDRTILDHYHQTMDERRDHGREAGHSQSGRILLSELQKAGAGIIAAGGSDWVIHPTDGAYTEDEEVFLKAILDTMEGALLQQGVLAKSTVQDWINLRRRQVAEAGLIFLTHQLDVCGRPPNP